MRWRRPGRPAPRQAAGERGRNAGPGGGAGPGSLARRRAGRRRAPWRPPVRGTVGPQRPRCAAAPSATPRLTNRSRAELTSPDVYLLRGRLTFGEADQVAPFPSALVVWGADRETARALGTKLDDAWHVPASAQGR